MRFPKWVIAALLLLAPLAYGGLLTQSVRGTASPGGDSPGDPLFFDDFEYAIARTDNTATMAAAFVSNGGWSGADAENGAGFDSGYLYTASSIEDYVGSFPGASSSSVLAMEGYPNNGQDTAFLQTDYYVAYGSAGGTMGDVPPDIWIQFWIYLQNSGSQLSSYPNRNKFLYPTPDGSTGNSDPEQGPITVPWLVLLGAQGYEAEMGPREENYIAIQAFGADRDTTVSDGDGTKLYQNLSSKKLTANTWHLVKIHIDTSGLDGSAEAWVCTQGDGAFTKVMEWVVGTTANFEWPTYEETRAGMKVLKMPTTENADPQNNPNRDGFGDNVKFMDDFAFGDAESDLPEYAACGG